MKTAAPLVFLDTETLGLDPTHDPIWELAAIRREPDGQQTTLHVFVQHTEAPSNQLPETFVTDYRARYDPDTAISIHQLTAHIAAMCADRPHIVGAVPNFDTERLSLARRDIWPPVPGLDPWHYHLIDVEALAVGYLRGQMSADPSLNAESLAALHAITTPPYDSGQLSRWVGVDPGCFARHTALGDVHWAMAVYDAVMA